MIKAVFFDVDGTLLSHTLKDVPKSTRTALMKLRQKNIKCRDGKASVRTGNTSCERY